MTDEDAPDTDSRRRRLATRKRRTRIVGAIVAIALIALGIGTAMALRSNDNTSATPVDHRASSGNKRPAPDSSIATAHQVSPPRSISHDDPLRLWIGGDSLAGSFGPALGQTGGATGVVDATIDYKVSSGLEDQGIRNWPEHAQQAMADNDPDHVVFIIGANDASIVNTYDSNDDGVHDWEVDYREKIDRMMEILVGGSRHRIVYWLGPPTMGDQSLNKGAYELGRVMRSEAAKFAPDVVYIDTYRLFADENGDYSRSLPDAHGEVQEMRISDGVHFSVDGAKYLADKLWTQARQALADHRAGRPVAADRLHDRPRQQRLRAGHRPLPSDRAVAVVGHDPVVVGGHHDDHRLGVDAADYQTRVDDDPTGADHHQAPGTDDDEAARAGAEDPTP